MTKLAVKVLTPFLVPGALSYNCILASVHGIKEQKELSWIYLLDYQPHKKSREINISGN
jgi:hypothetical protein